MKTVKADEIIKLLESQRNDDQREILMRFFQTAPGQYGEGDKFLGLKVPQTRSIVKQVKHLVPFNQIALLLNSEWHEVRLAALLLLVEEMKANLPKKNDSQLDYQQKSSNREAIANFYLKNAESANNWDLVDLSCPYILGPYFLLYSTDYMPLLMELAESNNLWRQRIAIVTTLHFIRNGIFNPTFTLVNYFCNHPHPLIHKAMGWMLREIGKKDKEELLNFLTKNYKLLPRTTLRYAIERFPENERIFWLKRK